MYFQELVFNIGDIQPDWRDSVVLKSAIQNVEILRPRRWPRIGPAYIITDPLPQTVKNLNN